MSDNKLTNLEIHIADLERTVGDLNDVLTDQWKVIDLLKQQNRILEARIRRLESEWQDQPQAKPPHY